MRTAFIGTSEFAGAILARLAATEHRPGLVLTRPDRPRGRGRRLASPPVAELARALGIPLEQPERINTPEVSGRIQAAGAEVVVVCAFGALISEPLLSDHELLNVHPSLLPRWRGAAPIERAIMAGDQRTGVTIMRITAGLDSGPVCGAAPEPIRPDDDYGTLAERLQTLGADLLLEALDGLRSFQEQEDGLATYAEKIDAEDRLIDPFRSAAELERLVRALHPHIGARVRLSDGTLLGVHRAALSWPEPSSEETGEEVGGSTPAFRVLGQRLLLDCASGVLELLIVQPAGGRPMDAASYLRGHGPPRLG